MHVIVNTLLMHDLTEKVKIFSFKKGAHLVGIASVDRFDAAPERYRPQFYISDAKAVISLGQKFNEALVNVLRQKKSSISFQHFVNDKLYDQVDELAYWVAHFLESQGYDAYPIPAQNPKDPRIMIGELSHKHAAVAAGLGQIGWNNLFLSPKFGPRQILGSVITNAPLKADPLYEGKVCEPDKCGYACLGVCASGAISRKKEEFVIGGRKYEHGKHSKWRCIWGCGSMSSVMSMPHEEISVEDLMVGSFREQLQKVRKANMLPEVIQNNLFLSRINNGEIPWCWLSCLTSCPVGSRRNNKAHQ
jgi:ferredoxin